MTWQDIEKQFDEEWNNPESKPVIRYQRVKSFLHSTLDEYVRELIGEAEDEDLNSIYTTQGTMHNGNRRAIIRNIFRHELLKQHEENLK